MDQVLNLTYHQLKCVFEADRKRQKQHYLSLANAFRYASAQQKDWEQYVRAMQ